MLKYLIEGVEATEEQVKRWCEFFKHKGYKEDDFIWDEQNSLKKINKYFWLKE